MAQRRDGVRRHDEAATVSVAWRWPAVVAPGFVALMVAMSAAAQTAIPACPPRAMVSEPGRLQTGRYELSYRTEPATIAVGQPFRVHGAFCRRDGDGIDSVRVDALMPEHGHGMNYKPTVTLAAGGALRAEGLVFHMPGRWHLTFAITGAGLTDNAAVVLTLE